MFLLKADDSYSDFYAGKTYVHQGSFYPVRCTHDKARRYTSRKRAENASVTVSDKTGQSFSVYEVSE